MSDQLDRQYEVLAQELLAGVKGEFSRAWFDVKIGDNWAELRGWAQADADSEPYYLVFDIHEVEEAFRKIRAKLEADSRNREPFTSAQFVLLPDMSIDMSMGYDPV